MPSSVPSEKNCLPSSGLAIFFKMDSGMALVSCGQEAPPEQMTMLPALSTTSTWALSMDASGLSSGDSAAVEISYCCSRAL